MVQYSSVSPVLRSPNVLALHVFGLVVQRERSPDPNLNLYPDYIPSIHPIPCRAQPNMLALYSFGLVVHREWGRDQFLAFYTSAAVVASLASHVATIGPLLSSSALQTAMRMGRYGRHCRTGSGLLRSTCARTTRAQYMSTA